VRIDEPLSGCFPADMPSSHAGPSAARKAA
jgi:hypothetical protein